MGIRGSVDIVTTKEATGWACAPDRLEGIMVHAVLNHEIVGDAAAIEHRSDLAAAGVGNGNCGFTVRFYRELNPLYLPFVSIKIDGGDAELPRGPQAGFVEFFSALYRAHPVAGHQRSVFGGLWTDRTDAAALLKGKTDIGQVVGATVTALSQLIHDGIAVIESPRGDPVRPRAKKNGGEPSVDQIRSVVEVPAALAVLRAVLEDHPFAFKVDIIRGSETELTQPSAESELSSPAECVAVVAPLVGEDVTVDLIRDSHVLPEFTPNGASRWVSPNAHFGIQIATAQQGRMTSYVLTPGTVAIIGPGAIHRIHCADGGAVKLLCAPSRLTPVTAGGDHNQPQVIRPSGIRIWALRSAVRSGETE